MKVTVRLSKAIPAKVLRFLGSRKFVYLIVTVFIFEGLWIALTGRYPGAFDENFHFGLIQLYAKHWLPFLDAQPPNAEVYGAVARDPSYLYHYLMSFPYRLFAHFVHNQAAQIVCLRIINVGLVTTSIFIYARVLRRTKLSSHIQNAILVLFTMIPVMPLLAGQINYDSLLFILVAVATLLALDFAEALRESRFELTTVAKFIAVCLLAALTKYAFLPIFAGFLLYGSLLLVRYRQSIRRFRFSLAHYLSHARKPHLIFYALLVLVASGLCAQRYGINLVRYHTLVPNCAQVMTVDKCSAYAPWQRDYELAKTNANLKRENLAKYSNMWIHQMVRETYFSAYAVFFSNGTVDYKVVDPLPIMTMLGWTLFISGTLASLVMLPKLWRNPFLHMFGVISFLYVLALFLQNYEAYRETAVPVSIHGRYLLPVLPFIFVIYVYAYREFYRWLRQHVRALDQHQPQVMLAGWAALMVLCLEGGGIITHIIRSDPDWFWQQNVHAQKVNDRARTIFRPLVVKGRL